MNIEGTPEPLVTGYLSGHWARQQIKNRNKAMPKTKQAVTPRDQDLSRITIFESWGPDYEEFSQGFMRNETDWECEIWIPEYKPFPSWESTGMEIVASIDGKVKFTGSVYDIGCGDHKGRDYKIYFCEKE